MEGSSEGSMVPHGLEMQKSVCKEVASNLMAVLLACKAIIWHLYNLRQSSQM